MPIIHMASNNDVEFPLGAVAVLNGWNSNTKLDRQKWLDDMHAGNVGANGLPYGPVITYETHAGACISEREHNMRDDSDFYMLVWDADKGCPESIMFASTRGWSYPCMGSYVDATPETLAAHAAWAEKSRRKTKANDIRYRRRAAEQLAKQVGCPRKHVERLRAAVSPEDYARMLKLFDAKLRSSFRISLRDNIIAWLKEEQPKHARPLSNKQMGYV